MVVSVIGIVVMLSVLDLLVHVGSGPIHVLMVIAVASFLWNLITGRRQV